MSLINEALKKAQRQRTDVPDADTDASSPGGRTVQKRAAPMRAQTMILVAAAAITLVVCSVVATVYLLTRKPAESVKTIAVTPAKLPAVDLNAPSPVIVAPVIAAPAATEPPPLTATRPTPASTPASSVAPTPKPSPAHATAVASAPAPAPASATPSVPASVSPAPKQSLPPDPRVLQFVDAIKVTGIRSSGSDSKVLMNDRVFRVNEVVERTLEVKLVKVASDSLTFEDANGVVYTKTF